MPRPKLADEANCIYHALNRGNAKSPIFKKDAQLHRHALDSCSASSLSKRMAAGWIHVLLSSRFIPVSKARKKGSGAKGLIFSLAVGAVREIAIGKYSGKQVGETSLLRTLLNTILPGDVLLADCCYATYWLLATAWQNDFDLVCKSHHKRKVDFRNGIKLGPLDQIIGYAKRLSSQR